MRALLGLLRLYRQSEKTESGVLTIGADTDTNRVYWVFVRSDGTVSLTYTGSVKLPETSSTQWR